MRWNTAHLSVLSLPLLVGVACQAVAPKPTPSAPAAVDPPRAIVLLTVDALPTGALALFGGPTPVPHLQELAGQGRAWGDAWTPCPMTRPAVATYLTGLTPDHHGVFDDALAPLGPSTPTLATALGQAGYRTAAFPASSFLGSPSGILRGFEVVDDPPLPKRPPANKVPNLKGATETAANIQTWLRTVPAGSRYFVWAHFADIAGEWYEQEVPNTEAAIQAVDAAIGEVLGALRERNDLEEAAVVVAGTFGDVSGGSDEPPGPGFSLGEPALRVPVIARVPSRNAVARDAKAVTWAPDVPMALARLAGAPLPGGDGVDLLQPPDAGRPLFAWTRATRDQMGWNGLVAVRVGTNKRIEGLEERNVLVDPNGKEVPADGAPPWASALADLLRSRPLPPSPQDLPVERVRALLAPHGVPDEATPREGRAFGPAATRRQVAVLDWQARRILASDTVGWGIRKHNEARELDPASLATLLERGTFMVMRGVGARAAEDPLGKAAALYPWHPEVIHWYAHALGAKDLMASEPLLELVHQALPEDDDVLYDLACTRSVGGDLAASEDYLRKAIQAGFAQWQLMETDPDLRNLRESPRFAAVMRDLKR